MAQHKGYEIPQELAGDILKSQVVDALLADPERKIEFQKLVKAKYPNVPIPEVDIPQQFEQHTEPLRKALAEAQAQVTEMKAQRESDARWGALHEGGLPKADRPEVEKLMAEKGITSEETAAEHLRLQRQVAPPRSMPDASLTFDTSHLAEFFKDPRRAARIEAEKAINEYNRARR